MEAEDSVLILYSASVMAAKLCILPKDPEETAGQTDIRQAIVCLRPRSVTSQILAMVPMSDELTAY